MTLCDPMNCSKPWNNSLSFTLSKSLLKLMSIESVMLSNHFILCRPILLLPSLFPSIRVFSSESALCIRWSKYWSFSIRAGNGSSQFSWWLPDKNAVLLYTIYFLFPPRKATSLNFHVIFSHFLHVGSWSSLLSNSVEIRVVPLTTCLSSDMQCQPVGH